MSARDQEIAADRKAGMKWDALKVKYKMSLPSIAKALRRAGALGPLKKRKVKKTKKRGPIRITIKPKGDLHKVNAALKKIHAAVTVEGHYFVTWGSNKIPSMQEYKTKADALKAVLDARLHNRKHIHLLKEIPFKLTVVTDD